jgi:hypothetical protein
MNCSLKNNEKIALLYRRIRFYQGFSYYSTHETTDLFYSIRNRYESSPLALRIPTFIDSCMEKDANMVGRNHFKLILNIKFCVKL